MKLMAIATNTFKEAVRDKILYNLLIFALLMIGGSILIATLTIGEQSKIIMDIGLASINLFGVLIAIFLGIGLVNKEIEKRTIYTILSKPIERYQFLLGKYTGLLMTLFVNTAIMTIGLFLVLMFNEARWGNSMLGVEPRIIEAVFLIFLELMVLTGVAILFSTFTTSTLAAIFSLSIYVIGHLSDELVGISQKFSGTSFSAFLKICYFFFPSLSQFDIKGQIVHGVPIETSYIFWVTLYALVYTAFLLFSASLIFRTRDFR